VEVHEWVPDPRRQDVERHSVHSSVHDHDYDHDDYDHGDAPARVVKTIIMDSDSTQWPVLMKTNYAEWSSMMKVKLEARRMWTVVRLGGVSRREDRRAREVLCSAVPTRWCLPSPGRRRPRTLGTPSLLHVSAATVPASLHYRSFARRRLTTLLSVSPA
jgi:hypothetical protein